MVLHRQRAKIDILCNRQIHNQRKLLENQYDAIFFRFYRTAVADLFALINNISRIRIRLVYARQAFHQRRFSCAILTAQCKHLAVSQIQARSLQRFYARECFIDVIHLQNKFIIAHTQTIPS